MMNTGQASSLRQYDLDALVDYLIAPSMASGSPIYGVTQATLSQYVEDREGTVQRHYFVHDDQLRPSSCGFSSIALIDFFDRNRHIQTTGEPSDYPAEDWLMRVAEQLARSGEELGHRIVDVVEQAANEYDDMERAVYGFVIPLPARLHLQASRAQRDALQVLDTLTSTDLLFLAPEKDREQIGTAQVMATIQEGIRFKYSRRSAAEMAGDDSAVITYAEAHLAEWVVVVEGVNGTGEALWEMVYDGSSSDRKPRTHLIRLLSTIFVVRPTLPVEFECSECTLDRYRSVSLEPTELILKTRGTLTE